MLEGLFKRKKADPLALIDEWKTSGLFRFSLRNYLSSNIIGLATPMNSVHRGCGPSATPCLLT